MALGGECIDIDPGHGEVLRQFNDLVAAPEWQRIDQRRCRNIDIDAATQIGQRLGAIIALIAGVVAEQLKHSAIGMLDPDHAGVAVLVQLEAIEQAEIGRDDRATNADATGGGRHMAVF